MWTMKDYLFLFKYCKVFISCDAGVWPMAAAMRKNLVFCNVTSCYRTTPNFVYRKSKGADEDVYEVVDWVYLHDGIHNPDEDPYCRFEGKSIPVDPEKEYYKENYSQIHSWMPKENTRVLKKSWSLYKSSEDLPRYVGSFGFMVDGPQPNTKAWATLTDTPIEDIITAVEELL